MRLATRAVPVRTALKPVEAYQLLRGFKGKAGDESFLLESAAFGNLSGRHSFIGLSPLFAFRSKGSLCRITDSEGKTESVSNENPFELLKQKFASFEATPAKLPFEGGFAGYFSYDSVRFFEKLPNLLPDDLLLPDSYFILPEIIVAFDNLSKETTLVSLGSLEKANEVEKVLKKNKPLEALAAKAKFSCEDFGESDFCKAVEKAKESIVEGEIFQVVLSRRKELLFEGDALAFYSKLRQINPSPHHFYFDFDGVKIIGSSPEVLVKLEGRTLTTKPIAGTMPRSPDEKDDEKLKQRLQGDEKERAEHLMLVDLHRNDLSRVCEYGSVKAVEFMKVEKYSHVQHLVSTITGKLEKGKDAFDALKACFPAGTVSGAPKVRAMEIIEGIEKHRRGPYGGAVGYFDFSGNMEFAITIRTAIASGNKIFLQAGAGIVFDSIPGSEFDETERKLGALIQATGGQ